MVERAPVSEATEDDDDVFLDPVDPPRRLGVHAVGVGMHELAGVRFR